MKGRPGRPGRFESQVRTVVLLEGLASGLGFVEAAGRAGVSPARVLRLMDDSSFRQAAVALVARAA